MTHIEIVTEDRVWSFMPDEVMPHCPITLQSSHAFTAHPDVGRDLLV